MTALVAGRSGTGAAIDPVDPPSDEPEGLDGALLHAAAKAKSNSTHEYRPASSFLRIIWVGIVPDRPCGVND